MTFLSTPSTVNKVHTTCHEGVGTNDPPQRKPPPRKENPPKRRIWVNAVFPEDLTASINKLSSETALSRSTLVRLAVRWFLAGPAKKLPKVRIP